MAAQEYLAIAATAVQRGDHATDESYVTRVWELAEKFDAFAPVTLDAREAPAPDTKKAPK